MEEIKEEVIEIEESPVYVEEDSIKDVQELNAVNKKIEEKRQEKDKKEDDIKVLGDKRKELGDNIGIINTGEHLNESFNKLTDLRKLDDDLSKEKAKLENIYKELSDLEEKGRALDTRTRSMVIQMTNDYNKKLEDYTKIVDICIKKGLKSDYEKAEFLVKDLHTYKKFENFEAILKGEEEQEKVKEEEKTESEPELSEVKVDNIEVQEEETKENEVVPTETEAEVKDDIEKAPIEPIPLPEIKEEPKEDVSKAPIEPIPLPEIKEEVKETIPDIPEKIDIPSFDELLNTEAPKADVAPIEPIPLPEIKEEKTVLLGKSDKIADSNKKGIRATMDAFNSQKEEKVDKTLTLAQ